MSNETVVVPRDLMEAVFTELEGDGAGRGLRGALERLRSAAARSQPAGDDLRERVEGVDCPVIKALKVWAASGQADDAPIYSDRHDEALSAIEIDGGVTNISDPDYSVGDVRRFLAALQAMPASGGVATYVQMPVDRFGNGPADPNETDRVEHQVWDAATNATICTTRDEATALRIVAALSQTAPEGECARRFATGNRVRKVKGSAWHGKVVGFYSTDLTPIGYAVESEREPGSVQIYPEAALTPATGGGA